MLFWLDDGAYEVPKFMDVKCLVWVLPDVGLVQQVFFVLLLVHAALLIGVDECVVIILLEAYLYALLALGKGQQSRHSEPL